LSSKEELPEYSSIEDDEDDNNNGNVVFCPNKNRNAKTQYSIFFIFNIF
jgi:hypothetical protein